jgi:hypothetical protein
MSVNDATTPLPTVRRLERVTATEIRGLAELLIDCVAGGASVSFMHPLSPEKATAFWTRVADDVAAGGRACSSPMTSTASSAPCSSCSTCRRTNLTGPMSRDAGKSAGSQAWLGCGADGRGRGLRPRRRPFSAGARYREPEAERCMRASAGSFAG